MLDKIKSLLAGVFGTGYGWFRKDPLGYHPAKWQGWVVTFSVAILLNSILSKIFKNNK